MKVNKLFKVFIVIVGLFSFVTVYALDETNSSDLINYSYVNETTSYKTLVDDSSNLLSDEEEKKLVEDMKPLTEYGNVAFVSMGCSIPTRTCASKYYYDKFGNQSGTLFMIDMNDRMLYIHSEGANYNIITDYKADVITDNVYRYASNGDYYGCASEAFRQVNKLLAGEKIAEPMRYITNALLSLFLGFLICFIFIMNASRMNKNTRRLKKNYVKNLAISNFVATVTGQHKVYNPPTDSGSGSGFSGGGGGGFSGGGGGGGHSSGGGGGHHF